MTKNDTGAPQLRALLLPTDGEPTLIKIEDDWQQLARRVNAKYIDILSTRISGVLIIIDEEARIYDHQKHNPLISRKLRPENILGPGIIMQSNPIDGQFMDLDDDNLARVSILLGINPNEIKEG